MGEGSGGKMTRPAFQPLIEMARQDKDELVGHYEQGWRNDFGGGGGGDQVFHGPKVTPSENGKVIRFSPLFFKKGPNQQNKKNRKTNIFGIQGAKLSGGPR